MIHAFLGAFIALMLNHIIWWIQIDLWMLKCIKVGDFVLPVPTENPYASKAKYNLIEKYDIETSLSTRQSLVDIQYGKDRKK